MLRIAIQSKGRLNEQSMALLSELGIRVDDAKRKFLSKAANFPLEVLYMRDDDIPSVVSAGMAFADKAVIDLMNNVKYPYNISGAAQREALKLLDKDISNEVAAIRKERSRILKEIVRYGFVEKVYPSQGNFVLAKVSNPDALYAHLVGDGIIVRNRNKVKGCEGCLRITVGLADENDRLFKSLGEYEKSNIRR